MSGEAPIHGFHIRVEGKVFFRCCSVEQSVVHAEYTDQVCCQYCRTVYHLHLIPRVWSDSLPDSPFLPGSKVLLTESITVTVGSQQCLLQPGEYQVLFDPLGAYREVLSVQAHEVPLEVPVGGRILVGAVPADILKIIE